MWYNEKRLRSPVKGCNYEFLPLIFSNLGHLECALPKRHLILKVSTEWVPHAVKGQ